MPHHHSFFPARFTAVVLSLALFLVSFFFNHALAQERGGDSLKTYTAPEVEIQGSRLSPNRPIKDISGTGLYAGKKTEAIDLNLIGGNFALNNTRQTFSRSAGIFVWEQDGGGIQAGISTRGLSPNRSWEFNTRQDGYDIASDPFGYPEAYYAPPFESLERIEIVRGSASLQYGPQFGGLLNYITKSAPRDKPLAVESSQTGGSFGYYSTYTALGGTQGGLSYYGYIDFRRSDGLRAGSGFTQYTGYLKLGYTLSPADVISLSVMRADYQLRQPAGLTEAQYDENARQSFRTRDWFGAPWLMPVLTYDHTFSEKSRLGFKAFGLIGSRNSIGLNTSTTIADSGTNRRRVNADNYRNIGSELRFVSEFSLFGRENNAVAAGLRYSRGNTERDQGRGTDGSAFDITFVAPKTRDLEFVVNNAAAFIETKISISKDVALSPGVRLENIQSTGSGTYTAEKSSSSSAAFDTSDALQTVDKTASETVPLFGLGGSVRVSSQSEAYFNVVQSYRPAIFSAQFQNDGVPVDANLKASRGVNADYGVRGTAGDFFSYDVSLFFLFYDDRVAVVNGVRTNAGQSEHYGIESYAELDLLRPFGGRAFAMNAGSLSLFTTAAYTSARYTRGPAAGKEVEDSPDWIVRGGLSYRSADKEGRFTASLQGSYVSEAFSDASNTLFQANGQQGRIPPYAVWDLSLRAKVLAFASVELSVNNLFDRRYFTRRATGYPGPGIVPAESRNVTGGIRFTF